LYKKAKGFAKKRFFFPPHVGGGPPGEGDGGGGSPPPPPPQVLSPFMCVVRFLIKLENVYLRFLRARKPSFA